jgi:hypothetical protein
VRNEKGKDEKLDAFGAIHMLFTTQRRKGAEWNSELHVVPPVRGHGKGVTIRLILFFTRYFFFLDNMPKTGYIISVPEREPSI